MVLHIKEFDFYPETVGRVDGSLPGFQHMNDIISRRVWKSLPSAQRGDALEGPDWALSRPGSDTQAEGMPRRDSCAPYC